MFTLPPREALEEPLGARQLWAKRPFRPPRADP